MRMTKILTMGFLVLAVGLASPATMPDKNKEQSNFRNSFYKDLKLTAEQTKQLEELRKTREKDLGAERNKLQETQKKLREELFKDEPSLTDIEIYKQDIRTLQAKQLDDMTQNMLDLKKVLTKEQLQTLKTQQEKGRGLQREAGQRGSQKPPVQKGQKGK